MAPDAPPPAPLDALLTDRVWIGGLARALARDRVDAEDVEQDALLAALEHPPDPARPPRPFLARVVANLVRRRVRGEGRRRAREATAVPPSAPADPARVLDRVARQGDLVQAVLALSEPSRTAILLHYFEGLTAVEIGRRLEVPAASVRQRLKRGRDELRRRLEDRWSDGLFSGLLVLAGDDPTPLTLAGALMTKKMIVAAVAVLAVGGLLRLRGATPVAPPPTRVARPSTAELHSPATGDDERPTSASRAPGVAASPRADGRTALGRTAPPRAEPPTGTLRVTLAREADGTPVAGSVVLVRWSAVGSDESELLALGTDAAGVARASGLRPGELRIGSLRTGDEHVRAEVVPGGEVSVALEVPRGVRVVGRVVDSGGAPVPGAEVRVTEPWNRMRGHTVARADDDGRFEVADAQPFGQNWVGARAPGLAHSRWHYFEGRPGDERELRLVLDRPAATLAGTVVDARGAPVPGAELLVGFESAEWAESRGGGPPVRGAADARGAFALPGVPLGPTELLARAPGHGLHREELEVTAAPRALLVALPAAVRVRGRVTAADGRPVSGARVRCGEPGALAGFATRSAEDGSFELLGLEPGAVEVVAAKERVGRAALALRLCGGESLEWDPVLRPAPALFGIVRDDEGRPLADVPLSAFVPVEGEPLQHSARTDGAGRYAFEELPDAGHTLLVPSPREDLLPFLARGLRPSLEPFDVRLAGAGTTGTFSARVLAPDGRPAVGATLEARHATRPVPAEAAEIDPRTGEVELRFAAGTSVLVVESGEYAALRLGERSLAPGARLDLGVLRLEEPARVTLVPLVRGGAAGVSLEDADVEWSDAQEHPLGEGSRASAAFASPLLPPGRVSVVVQAEGLERERLELDVRAGEHVRRDLELRRAGVAVVALDLPPGAARPGVAWIELWDGERLLWASDRPLPPAGEPLLRASAPAGTWRLEVGTDTGLHAAGTLRVPGPGLEAAPVRVALAP